MKMPWPYTAKRTDGRVLLQNLPAGGFRYLRSDFAAPQLVDDRAFAKAMGC